MKSTVDERFDVEATTELIGKEFRGEGAMVAGRRKVGLKDVGKLGVVEESGKIINFECLDAKLT